VSGCRDRADAVSIVLGGLDRLTQSFAYEYGNPPAALCEADESLHAPARSRPIACAAAVSCRARR
jgi:hypothetical protein